MTHVVVVGGGISGLASAHFARRARPGARVTVLEGSPRAGGNVRTLRRGGMPVEAGPDTIVMGRPEVGALLDGLGLTPSMVAPAAGAGRVLVAHGGALSVFPDGLVFGVPTRPRQLATTRLLSLRGKARAALDLVLPSGDDAPRSVGALVERRLGREVKERLVEPMLGGVFAADVDRLDPAVALPMLEGKRGSLIRALAGARRPSGGGLRAPAEGMSALVDALVRELGDGDGLRLQQRASRVRRSGAGYVVTVAGAGELACDHVVVAVPPAACAVLTAELDGELSAAASALSAASTATVLLVFPPGTRLPDASGVLVPRTEGRTVLAATFVNAKWARPSDTGEVVVRAFVGGARSPALVEESDDDALVARSLADLRAYLPLPAPTRADVVRFVGATPQPELGHRERVARVRAAAARHPGLSLVSAAYEGPGIAGCVAQAARVGAALERG
ncbi:MAG: protoporphyrinogen oxidase [Polyangiaceae bacterium]|nr:protoporphyrinogen oxidase [Polyangiaceae bacterium]